MASHVLNWTPPFLNANITGQRALRIAKANGAVPNLTTTFAPANDLSPTASTTTATGLQDNTIYIYNVQTICTAGGPIDNISGFIEEITFTCLSPTDDSTGTSSFIQVTVPNPTPVDGGASIPNYSDIDSIEFSLYNGANTTLLAGPFTEPVVMNTASHNFTGLTGSTSYTIRYVLISNVNGVNVRSDAASQIGTYCSYTFSTDASALLVWIPDEQACETAGGFSVIKNITGLSSPFSVMYDTPTGLVYGTDADNIAGNIFWFDPDTATVPGDITYSPLYQNQETYTSASDPVYRRLYLMGRYSGGLKVYNIATNTLTTVAFGTDGTPFNRIEIEVGATKIYCKFDSGVNIAIIDRATLVIDSIVNTSSIPDNSRFSVGGYSIREANNKLYISAGSGSFVGTIGVYNLSLTFHHGNITLPGVAPWDFGRYWGATAYDSTTQQLYASDYGSSSRYVIDTTTDTVLNTSVQNNRSGKSNALHYWTIDQNTNELYALVQCLNTSVDSAIAIRTYREDKNTFQYLDMYEGQYFSNLSPIVGTGNSVGCFPGQTFWTGNPAYNTDGTISIISTTAGTDNTGRLLTITLQEVDANNGNLPTGNTKPNIPSDPDYVPPEDDAPECPVSSTLACPTNGIVTHNAALNTLYYEFAIMDSVKANPSVDNIAVYVWDKINDIRTAHLPQVAANNKNYFSGTFTTVVGGTGNDYTVNVVYRNAVNTELQNCWIDYTP